jgi:hypothetical protein
VVTAGAHHREMSKAPDTPELMRVGALVLRVWQEGTADDPRLRIRLIGREDVTRDVVEQASASTIEEALAHVRCWLEGFCSSTRGSSVR